MSRTVGEVNIKLSFDSKSITTEQSKVQAQVEKGWSKTGAAIANVISNVITKALSMMTSSISSAIDRIDTLNQFPKVLQNFGVSAEEAAEATNRIRDSVLGLPTSLDDAIAGVQKLFMVTNNLRESEALFSAVNDAAIVFANGSSQAISNFIYGYSQSLAAGKIQAEEFNQMNEAIPGIMAKIAESMGMNVGQMKDMLSTGGITIEEFNEAFKKLDKEGSASMGALSESAFTASGGIKTSISLMQSAIERSLSAIINAFGVTNLQNIVIGIGNAFEYVGGIISKIITFLQGNTVFNDLVQNIKNGLTLIGKMLEEVFINHKDEIINIWNTIGAAISEVVAFVARVLAAVIPIIGKIIDVANAISTWVSKNGETIKMLLVGIGTALVMIEAKTLAVSAATKVVAIAQGIWTAITAAINAYRSGLTIATAIQTGFNTVMSANPIFLLVTVLASVTAALAWFFTQTEAGKQVIQSFGEAVGSVFNWIGEKFNEIGNWINEVCTNIGNAFNSVGEWARGVFQGIWDFVTGIFSGIGSFFQGVWDSIVGVFTSVGVTVGEAVSGAFKSVVNGLLSFVEGFINSPIDILNGFIDIINTVFGAVGVNLGKIDRVSLPRMAQGGLVSSATAAVIGEAGQEAVLPLERNTGNWSGLLADTLLDAMAERGGISETGGIIVNQTNYINNEMDADDIGRRMMTSIRRAAL